MKKIAAWIVGLIAWTFFSRLIGALGHALGIPVLINFDKSVTVVHRLYEEEIDSAFTTFGLSFIAIATLLSIRLGMAVYAGHWRGGVSAIAELRFTSWLVGLSLYGIIGAVLYKACQGIHNSAAPFILNLLDLSLAIGLYFGMKKWYDHRLSKLKYV